METTLTEEITMQKQSKYLPWIVCFTAALFFFYEYIQMNMFNAISQDVMRDFSITATGLSKLSAYYFYATLTFFPIAGALLDRFSTRKIILSTILLCNIGIMGFALTHSITLSYMFRALSGIGSAFCFLSSMRLASRWFPAERMALISGLIVTMAMIGGVVAQTPLTLLTQWLGWRDALLMDATLGFAIMVAVFFMVRDYPAHAKEEQRQQTEAVRQIGVLQGWKKTYLNYQNWLCGIYTNLLNLPLALLGAIWGGLYLQQILHFDAVLASQITTMLFVGTIVGGPLLGHISDKIGRRKPLMYIGAVVSLAIVATIIYMPSQSALVNFILFLLLGFFTSTQVLSYPFVAEGNSKALTASSVSVVSLSVISGYPIFQQVFGGLMDANWHGTMVNNVRIYSANDFHNALIIMPIGFIIAFFAVFFMRETYCKRKD